MTVINKADAIYLGSAKASAVYAGANKIWPQVASLPKINLITSYSIGATRANYTGTVGLIFQLNATLQFNKIGCRCGDGPPPAAQRLRLWNVDTGVDIATTTINLTGKTPGNYYYADMPLVALQPSVQYALWAEVFAGNGYLWPDSGNTMVLNGNSWTAIYGSTFNGTAGLGDMWRQYYGVDLAYV